MPILNPDKCYTQQPRRLAITMPTTLPKHWLTDFYAFLSAQLKLNDDKTQAQEDYDHQTNTWRRLTKKELFFKALERHLGEQSTYSFKPQLLDSFRTLYFIFMNPKTSDDQRYLIASRIADNVEQCTPGFHNQVNFLITLFNMPQNQDELIAQVRFKLVDKIARIIAEKNTQGIHVHNRVIEVARNAGFGVWPINPGDAYFNTGSRNLSDAEIISRLRTGFDNHFQLFALLNALRAELEALIAPHGYQGKRALENEYRKEEYEKFFECLNRFVPMQMGELLEIDEMSGKITDINWQYIKHQLLQKLRAEKYVTLSEEESALLDKLDKSLLDETSSLNSTTLTPLISNGYELVQCLEFFSEWNMEQKAALVRAYLNHQSPHDQKEVLAILHNEAPQLTAQLKKEPNLQAIYFAIAIAEKDAASVRTYIEQGEDINEALLLLFSQAHKSETLYWLHEHPHLLQKMTVAGMNTVIDEGKYQGKTVAETLVSTKKGRQLLLENSLLQTLLAQTTMANTLANSLQQADTERRTVSTQEGFFKKSSPLAIELVQSVVYGDLRKLEALLQAIQANPSLLETLLTEKVTVIDYSRRKIKQKTAFQAALCARDEELCAMLAHYMPKEEMTRQYQEIFPKGHETYSKEQTSFDFNQIVEAISRSSNADVEKALSLELPNNTVLWVNLEQFRSDLTQRSSQEAVFNPQHLLKAFELYDSQFDNWNWNQRDLFWRQVVGFVQRFLPANSAMDFAQGLYNRVENQEKSSRSFKFKYGDGSIFPPVFDSFSGLGYEYAGERRVGGGGLRAWGGAGRFFKTYVEQKQQSWENYTARGCQQSLFNSVV
jgi:flagellar basal body-associated protein FliL